MQRRSQPSTYGARRIGRLTDEEVNSTGVGRKASENSQPNASVLIGRLTKEEDFLKRRLLLAGYITKLLEEAGGKVYVVGGFAAEVYTAGQFTTGDLDIVASDREKFCEVVKWLGFRPVGRVWMSEELGIAVDLVGSDLSGSQDRTRTFEISDLKVSLIGIEDLAVKSLAATKFWGSPRELERAYALLKVHRKKVDWEYLRRRAAAEKVDDLLGQAREYMRRKPRLAP
jgi:hypothetical protein